MDGLDAVNSVDRDLSLIEPSFSSREEEDRAREAWEAQRLREHLLQKAAYKASLVTLRITHRSVQNLLESFAVQLAKTINDFAVQPKLGERWTPAWVIRFTRAWHEVLFRESAKRLLRDSMKGSGPDALTKDDTLDSVLSLPRVQPQEFSDRRCFALVYRAALEIPLTEEGDCLMRIGANHQNSLEPVETKSPRVAFTEDGLELLARLRRWDPSGRRSIALYRAWAENCDRRRRSVRSRE